MSKEIILGALVGTELQRMRDKLDFYGLSADFQKGDSWASADSLTLEQFLEKNPIPETPDQTVLYGIAWEFIWGKKPPQEVTDAKNAMLAKNRTGITLNDMEKLWLKLIVVDTDMF